VWWWLGLKEQWEVGLMSSGGCPILELDDAAALNIIQNKRIIA
jgi:hypothetical protein